MDHSLATEYSFPPHPCLVCCLTSWFCAMCAQILRCRRGYILGGTVFASNLHRTHTGQVHGHLDLAYSNEDMTDRSFPPLERVYVGHNPTGVRLAPASTASCQRARVASVVTPKPPCLHAAHIHSHPTRARTLSLLLLPSLHPSLPPTPSRTHKHRM